MAVWLYVYRRVTTACLAKYDHYLIFEFIATIFIAIEVEQLSKPEVTGSSFFSIRIPVLRPSSQGTPIPRRD